MSVNLAFVLSVRQKKSKIPPPSFFKMEKLSDSDKYQPMLFRTNAF